MCLSHIDKNLKANNSGITNSLWCFITFMNCDSVGVAAGIKFNFDLIALKWRLFGSLLVQSAFIFSSSHSSQRDCRKSWRALVKCEVTLKAGLKRKLRDFSQSTR